MRAHYSEWICWTTEQSHFIIFCNSLRGDTLVKSVSQPWVRTSEQASEWRVEMFEGGKGGQQKITRGVSAETKKSLRCALFFTKMAISGLFFVHFGLFQTNITILEQYHVKKCLSSIQCWDTNPRPVVCESPPITIRPGLTHLEMHSF